MLGEIIEAIQSCAFVDSFVIVNYVEEDSVEFIRSYASRGTFDLLLYKNGKPVGIQLNEKLSSRHIGTKIFIRITTELKMRFW